MPARKLLIVVTGTATFSDGKLPTGLWLSEFTHIFHSAKQRGHAITIANPRGGETPVDPESLEPMLLDRLSEAYWKTPGFRQMLNHAKRLDDLSGQTFDCVYLAGGHGAMYDFPQNEVLQQLIRDQYESGRLLTAICHGVCGLLDVKRSDGSFLLHDKRVTGYSWFEERLARRRKVAPYNLEAQLKLRGARYEKAFIPMTSKVVCEGNLITGQNPFSSPQTAKAVLRWLDENNASK